MCRACSVGKDGYVCTPLHETRDTQMCVQILCLCYIYLAVLRLLSRETSPGERLLPQKMCVFARKGLQIRPFRLDKRLERLDDFFTRIFDKMPGNGGKKKKEKKLENNSILAMS